MTINSRNCCMFLLIIVSSFNISCKSQTDYTLNEHIVKYLKDSFDIQQEATEEQKVVNSKIRNGKILAMAVDSNKNSYFLIADIKSKRIDYNSKNIIDKYYSTIWDMGSHMIVAASAQRPYDLSITNITTGNFKKENFPIVDWLSSTDIVINGDQLFYLNGVTGVAFVNIENTHYKVFKNPGILTTNYKSAIISYPLDSTLNLLSGHTTANNTIQMYAIDKYDSIQWKYSIKQNQKREPISLLNYSHSFIVKYDSVLVALDKSGGKEAWHDTFKNSISEVYKYQDKILVYCLVNPASTYPDKDEFKYEVVLKLIDSKNGEELWNKNINSINIPHIGICANSLLISDNKSFSVFSLSNGDILEKREFTTKDKGKYAFEMLTDMITGDYYIRSCNGKIYW